MGWRAAGIEDGTDDQWLKRREMVHHDGRPMQVPAYMQGTHLGPCRSRG